MSDEVKMVTFVEAPRRLTLPTEMWVRWDTAVEALVDRYEGLGDSGEEASGGGMGTFAADRVRWLSECAQPDAAGGCQISHEVFRGMWAVLHEAEETFDDLEFYAEPAPKRGDFAALVRALDEAERAMKAMEGDE